MRSLVPCTCALLVLLGGCGRGQPLLAPVSGRVYYRGQPLPGGTLVFTPDPERGGSGPLACAEIGPDGRYSLVTGQQPGAVLGWHRITVAPAGPTGKATEGSPPRLPRHFSDPELSGKCVEVKAEPSNTIDLYLE
jgi:hypothetical protein